MATSVCSRPVEDILRDIKHERIMLKSLKLELKRAMQDREMFKTLWEATKDGHVVFYKEKE